MAAQRSDTFYLLNPRREDLEININRSSIIFEKPVSLKNFVN